MTEKTITLRAELVERLEALAQQTGQSIDDILASILNAQTEQSKSSNWAMAVVRGMAEADIDWVDAPDLSEKGSRIYREDLHQRWAQSQQGDTDDD